MKTELTEFTSTDGFSTATWHVKITLTPKEEAALWKVKYERMKRNFQRACRLSDIMIVIAIIEFAIIVFLR